MTDIYFIGCQPQIAALVRDNPLILNEAPGPDHGYHYWQIRPLHGDMDLPTIDEQWALLGDPAIPEEVKQLHIDSMRQAASFRYQLYHLFVYILAAGYTPHFIDNDLGVSDGEWSKFMHPVQIQLDALLRKPFYHGDQWYCITSESEGKRVNDNSGSRNSI